MMAFEEMEYIDALELDHDSFPNGKEHDFFHAERMVSFTENLTPQNKEDVLNGTLFAQLSANKKFNRYKDTKNWYKFYVEVLQKIGWVVQQFKFTPFETQESSLKVSDACLGLIKEAIGDNKGFYESVVKTIEAMEDSTKGVELFGNKSYPRDTGNFQIVPCTTNKSGQVIAAVMCGYFSASKTQGNYFFSPWKKEDIKLFYSIQTLTLDESSFAQVRALLKKRLRHKAKHLINNVDV